MTLFDLFYQTGIIRPQVHKGWCGKADFICLSQGLGLSKAEALPLLHNAGIAPERRAETLNLEEWAELWRVFTQRKGE